MADPKVCNECEQQRNRDHMTLSLSKQPNLFLSPKEEAMQSYAPTAKFYGLDGVENYLWEKQSEGK